MIKALAATPKSSFVNPGVNIPSEPKIEQDDDKKDKDKDKDKEDGKTGKNTEDKKESDSDKKSVSTTPVKKSMKERVQDIIGEPVVSNKPTPAK